MTTITIKATQYALAALIRDDSISERIETVSRFQLTLTKKITALTDVIERTKAFRSPENSADFMIGSEMLKNVFELLAPRIIAASSMLGSTWRRLFDPVSTPIERVRNTMATMMMNAVPVSLNG